MTSIAMTLSDFGADIVLKDGDLLPDTGLVSAVFLSLFSDARAPDGHSEVRGWWPDDRRDRFGSHLWLMGREKLTNETALKAQSYAQEALQWLIDDGIASAVRVTADIVKPVTLSLHIQITRGDASRYAHLWDLSSNQSVTVNNTDLTIEFN